MKITSPLKSPRPSGYALLVTMTFMGIMLVLFGAMLYDTISNSTITKMNNQYNASEAAAEAATEKVLSQMTHDFEFSAFSNSSAYYASGFLPDQAVDQADWPVKYNYSDSNGSNGQITVTMPGFTSYTVPLSSQYAGLRGYTETVTLTATATPTTAPVVPATVTETVQFADIPLFQFAIFYNMNLEIAAASTLNIYGPVYSNAGLWSGSTSLTFYSTVSAVGLATNATDDPFCSGYSGSGPATYTVASQPTSGNDTLTMPVGTNNNPASVEAIINLPPSNYTWGSANAFTTNGQLYCANAADLFLTNSANGTNWGTLTPQGTNFTLYYQDGLNAPNYETWVTNDYYILKTGGTTNYVNYASATAGINSYTNVKYASYSFLTNVLFYDWREGYHGGSGPPKAVQAVQIDLIKFNTWLNNSNVNGGHYYNNICNNHKSRSIDSIYVYNAVPLTSTTLPAVRLVNGGEMPPVDTYHGFTMATAMPAYVWGDYNVSNSSGSSISQNSDTYTEPAGIMADAISVLSDHWSDTVTNKDPTASSTTINAACLEGIVASTNNAASDANGYSGGVENFLRLLENWSGQTLTYNGSIVVMFPSQYATNCWQQTGGYYTAATRHWAFDTNFEQDVGLPPLNPCSSGVIRSTWSYN